VEGLVCFLLVKKARGGTGDDKSARRIVLNSGVGVAKKNQNSRKKKERVEADRQFLNGVKTGPQNKWPFRKRKWGGRGQVSLA